MKNNSNKATRGFTLVELLVVIGILGTISSMFIYAYRAARVESQNQKSRSTVEKISDVLSARLLEYENYPVPLAIPSTAVPRIVPGARPKQELVERARLIMLREIIRTEMPDHPDDLKATYFWFDELSTMDPFVIKSVPTGLVNGTLDVFVPPLPGVRATSTTSRAVRLFETLKERTINRPPPFTETYRPWDAENANAELLFLIIADSEFDGSTALEMFDQSEIADTDQDGLNEFVDAFGGPIKWIRWPTGFQIGGKNYPDMLNSAIVDQATQSVSVDSEPYDRLKADPGWRTTNTNLRPGVFPPPLVVSAGPDGFFGLNFREIDRYTSVVQTPRWPLPNTTSYSVCDLPFLELPAGVPAIPYLICDPWAPRTDASMRMGSFLQAPAGPNAAYDPMIHDPREGGVNAQWTNPRLVSTDNITNFDGSANSL
ncbi:MAG: type II secretion system protein [Pirellula sp.]|jgi:prepilin-type N-terminal cleavage/methylation domain-containing protein